MAATGTMTMTPSKPKDAPATTSRIDDGRIQIDGVTLDLRYEEGVLDLLDRDEEDDDRPDLAGVGREHDDDA